MKLFSFFLPLLLISCYGEQLLGGWSISNDDVDNHNWLRMALIHINVAEINNDIQSRVSDLICRKQIVNGLNIKCSFVLQGEKWECSYYQSFVPTLNTEIEKCQKIEAESNSEENDDEQEIEPAIISNDDELDEQVVVESPSLNEDNEAEIDTINNNNLEEKRK